MALKKYYNLLTDENNLLKPESITYFTTKHIYNYFSKKDSVKNVIIKDLGDNYVAKYIQFVDSCDRALGFVYDDIYDLYEYTRPHCKRILNNPRSKILKEKTLIRKEKLKVIDSNTFKWLGPKTGNSIKEKLSNVSKVMSTVKQFSYDTKENQVTKSFLKQINSLIVEKLDLMEKYPKVFGNISDDVFVKDIKRNLNKTKQLVKDIFEDVADKEHGTPNNTLIGNEDYAGVWKAYRLLKSAEINFDVNDNYFKFLCKIFMLNLMAYHEYKFIESPSMLFEEDGKYVIYSERDTEIKEIIVDVDESCKIKESIYVLNNGNYEVVSSKEHVISCSFNSGKNILNRGLAAEIFINGEYSFDIYADFLGTKNFITKLNKMFEFETVLENKRKELYPSMVFINSYSNTYRVNKRDRRSHLIFDSIKYMSHDRLYFVGDKNIYLNMFDSEHYFDLLNGMKTREEDVVIYDIKDTFDEFSSGSLRRQYSMAFPKSYPVWRSILAGESCENRDKIKYVLDFNGSEFYVSELGRKNGLFVHCGPIESNLQFFPYTELDFLKNYIEKYEEKHQINFSEDVKKDWINSGELYSILEQKKGYALSVEGDVNTHSYYFISFEFDVFYECYEGFVERFNDILETYPLSESVYVLPNFLRDLKKENIKINSDLLVGANIIKTRVLNNKTTWYERLPKLSLEIINNGYFDTLMLVDDSKEYENIIGKSISFDINKEFTLFANQDEYILPLNKSFLGEQNKSFVAKLRDPSFPLKEDCNVRLRLRYNFSSENSYELTFIPVSKEAPFTKAEAVWEEATYGDNLRSPEIKDTEYSKERSPDFVFENYVKKSIDNIDSKYDHISRDTYNFVRSLDPYKYFMKDIRRLTNDCQRLFSHDFSYFGKIQNYMKGKRILDAINLVRERVLKSNEDRYYVDVCDMEQALVMLTLDKTYFIGDNLQYPFASYGRYLSIYSDDLEVIEMAYNCLNDLIIKQKDILTNKYLRTFIDRMTSSTACNHLFFEKATKVNPVFTTYFLKFLVDVLKRLSEYKFMFNRDPIYDNKFSNPLENAILMRFILELIISYLSCRKSVYFDSLKPGGKLANQIIYYLKVFNRNFMDALDKWPKDNSKEKVPRFTKMKYKMKAEKIDAHLYKMWDELYCVILYLSGSDDVNYISIEVE